MSPRSPDKEEAEVRRAIDERLGDIVFGVDDESMEDAIAARLKGARRA